MTFMYVGCAHGAWTGAPAREFYLLRSDSIRPLATADDWLLAFSQPNYARGIRQANEGE
jgi:hypothetical protein